MSRDGNTLKFEMPGGDMTGDVEVVVKLTANINRTFTYSYLINPSIAAVLTNSTIVRWVMSNCPFTKNAYTSTLYSSYIPIQLLLYFYCISKELTIWKWSFLAQRNIQTLKLSKIQIRKIYKETQIITSNNLYLKWWWQCPWFWHRQGSEMVFIRMIHYDNCPWNHNQCGQLYSMLATV